MGSPFPGMDPYLERYWRDVHNRLIVYASDRLQAALPAGLKARIDERVYLDTSEYAPRSIYPDVAAVEHPTRRSGGAAVLQAPAAGPEPFILHLLDEEVREGFIEIRDVRSGGRVVTVIEFLSPTNKLPGHGRDVYRQKQEEVLTGGASLVEIDLTRTGTWTFSIGRDTVPRDLLTPYFACVRRSFQWSRAELYPLPLSQPLRPIRIPLRESDEDVWLHLQPLVDHAYENGAYEDEIDYSVPPEPPLEGEDAAWAEAHLRGVREGV